MLRTDLCYYSDAYIVAKERMSVRVTNDANKRNKKLTFKNNAPFRSCISKIKNTFIDSAEDLDIVRIILWHQEVCGIIIEMKQMILLMRLMIIIIW